MIQTNFINPGPNRTELLFQSLEPGKLCDESDLTQLLWNFRRKIESDPRHIRCDLQGKIEGDHIVLSGNVMYRNMLEGIEWFLTSKDWQVDVSRVEVMPGPSLQGKRFALVNLPACSVYRAPDEGSERVTSGLYAEPVFLLLKQGDWFFAQTFEGYLGWISQDSLSVLDDGCWNRWHQSPKIQIVRQFECDGLTIPPGTILPIDRDLNVSLVNGRKITIHEGMYILNDDNHLQHKSKIVEIAKQFLGKPYCWGARSTETVDCSGFVQTVYRYVGVHLPRDANQQFITGMIAGTPDWKDNIQAGDLLFFANSSGILGHVAIAIGGLQYIHALSTLGVVMNSLNPNDPDYQPELSRNFILAKRCLS